MKTGKQAGGYVMSLAEKIRSAPPELIRLWVANIWYSRDTKICDVSLEDISFERFGNIFGKRHFIGTR